MLVIKVYYTLWFRWCTGASTKFMNQMKKYYNVFRCYFYPNLVIKKDGHQDISLRIICDQYEWFFNERKKIPKSNPMNYVYKIILNSTFGLSNDENSFFYDPELCMKITVNGQLTLMMLYEQIMERIPDAVALLHNTDGIETMIPRQYYDDYMKICEEWEDITNLQLEHDEYQS